MARFQEVLEKLSALIESGSVRGGEKLPPERVLAETFGASRTSVREAIRILAERGVLESRQGDGTYLRAPGPDTDPDGLRRACAEAFDEHRRRLGEILAFRRILEPGVAALAAQNIAPAELERLKALACDQQRRLLAHADDADVDAAFHLALARATGNRVLVDVLTALAGILAQSRSEHLRGPERKRLSHRDHLRIIDALERRDPDLARRVMKEHLACIAADLAEEIEP
ncbi:MAG: FadR/GntR family transcriptional regulator [Desulfovibrionaceae bacterium]